MNFIYFIVHKLYVLWVCLVFTFFMLLFLPGLTLPFIFGIPYSRIGYFFLWLWSWLFSALTRIRYRFEGLDHIKKGEPYIYVSNHTSFLDLPGLRLLLPGEFRPLAKKEILSFPIFGWIARGCTVSVDRSSAIKQARSMDKLKAILVQGISILIFPEGTQNRSTNLLQPFKDGAFRIAIDSQKNIVPIVIHGAGEKMPPGTLNLRPGIIVIQVGLPIATTGLTQADAKFLNQQTYRTMLRMLESLKSKD